MLRQRWMMVLAVGVMLVLGTSAAQAGEALKIGFVYVSPIGDAGWTYQHDLGRKAMEQALGNKVVTKYVENVPEGADAERGIRAQARPDHVLRLHESDHQGGSAVPQCRLHARHGLQVGQERRHL